MVEANKHLAWVFLSNSPCTILDMSNSTPQKREWAYRHRVICSECKTKISVTVKLLIKKASQSCFAKFYNIDSEILEEEQKMYASFRRVRGLGYMTVSEMREKMQENDLFDLFPEFSKLVHILAVIPAISCSAERSFSALCRLKTNFRSTMGQQRVSNIALLTLKGHMPTL